jgi:hypothetical protein
VIEVFSRAHRILKPLSGYHDLSENRIWPIGAYLCPTLNDGEYPLGLYVNDPINFHDTILFTNLSLYILQEKLWVQIAYAEIERVISPNSKSETTGITIIRHDGREFFLPVRGVRAGRFFDAFEVLRFFDRIRADTNKLD